MPLTQQPFAAIPSLKPLEKDLRMNMPDSERAASGAVGFALLGTALNRQGPSRWIFAALGALLLRRAWTGHSRYYAHVGRDRRHETSGVQGDYGTKVEHTIEIHRSPEVLFAWWRALENLPRAMRHLVKVRSLSPRRSYWQARAPFGQVIDWYAEIIHETPGESIAWQSLPGSAVASAGSVRFEPNGAGGTHLRVTFQYDPPAGALGAAVASLFGTDAQQELVQDLATFKEFAERELEPFPGASALSHAGSVAG